MSSNDQSKIGAHIGGSRWLPGHIAESGKGVQGSVFLVRFAPGHHMLRFEIAIRRHG
jgi:hypothetical protein